MGCECLNVKKIEKEIITYNTEKNYFFVKTDNIRNKDTYINSMKTSDKNTISNKNDEIIQTIRSESNFKNIRSIKKEKISNYINISPKKKKNENINNLKKEKNIRSISKTKTKSETLAKKGNTSLLFNKEKSKTNLNSKKISSRNVLLPKLKTKKPLDDFSQYIFIHINKIRENPQSYIDIIEESKQYIKYNNSNKLIFKKNVKVALDQGLPAFEEAISILKMSTPMNKLIFEPKLVVKLPQSEEEILNKEYFKKEVNKMIKKGIPIKTYWRDIINEKETSFLMMIVDDTGIKAGMKRKDILDPDMKYIGIGSTNIGKYFICFVTFSDCKV